MDGDDVDRFRGLDMNHGFIKSIIKNQIDRDEFHKVMEERKVEVQQKMKETSTPNRRRSRPAEGESKLYVPPHLRRGEPASMKRVAAERPPCPAVISEVEESTLRERVRTRAMATRDEISIPTSSNESVDPTTTSSLPLFILNLKTDDGEDVQVAVMTSDNAARLAKQLGRKYNFSEDQCRMLRLTLDHELETRLAAARVA